MTDDLKKELASLRLDDQPPRSRRGAWVVIALLVFMVATGTIFWWGRGVLAATEVETTPPRVDAIGRRAERVGDTEALKTNRANAKVAAAVA